MSHFVLVFDPEKSLTQGHQSDLIVDWGEYSNSQQLANLSQEFMSRQPWNTPIKTEHRTERGGSSSGCIFSMVMAVKEDIEWNGQGERAVPIFESGRWKKEPKWKGPYSKSLMFLGNFQVSKQYPPIPIQRHMSQYACKRNKNSKEYERELLIRFIGPGESYSLDTIKLRMFGAIDNDPYSNSELRYVPSEPRPYHVLHNYDMAVDGTLTHESEDFLQACIDFYGTEDLMEMKSLNTRKIHEAVIEKGKK